MKKLLPLLMILTLLSLSRLATACPMCKDTIAQNSTTQPTVAGTSTSDDTSGLGGGFNNSVYLMLGGLVGVMGLVAFGMFRAVHSANSVPAFTPSPRSR